MPPYEVRCTATGCTSLARFKVAANWSDGSITEQKTYGLSCPSCLTAMLQSAQQRQSQCRLTLGEVLETPTAIPWPA